MNPVRVRMGDYVVSNSDKLLVTTVGSCVAIGISDGNGIGGLAHIMLPEFDGKTELVGKYADTAIPTMVEEMKEFNANFNGLQAKIAGGAQMFSFPASNTIGQRNVQKVKELLQKMGIAVKGEDVGSEYGRTVEFHTTEGKMLIKQSNTIIMEL